jgi:predicted alpha/beta-hydrolase family hydrolase
MAHEIRREALRRADVCGVLHLGGADCRRGLVLTHGAGGNMNSGLLTALADEFAARDFTVLRCDLPFRQLRPHGPPRPGDAARDREGLAQALEALGACGCGENYLGGQSYGGRQASMLAGERPQAAAGLLLLSYPLHPPGKPAQLRTQHFERLRVPVLFVEGTRDPFGTIEEMEAAARLIPAKSRILTIDGVGHDLGFARKKARHPDLPGRIYAAFAELFPGR